MADLIDDTEIVGELPKDYKKAYAERGFWDKLANHAKSAGQGVVGKALTVYYVMADQKTPVRNKATAIAALGYFISPMDAVPDLIVGLGYTDDFGVLVAALTALSSSITDEISARAETKAQEWFN